MRMQNLYGRGATHRTAKYTDAQVQSIIDAPSLEAAYAVAFSIGMGKYYAAKIYRRQAWTHLKRSAK